MDDLNKTSNIDPVSGNEIPPGSTAKNVRDDIDAKLSEGEYVIPADAVKYYGVAYFEKLIGKAKDGLKDMEDNGRIGGETPKEAIQELNEEGGVELEFASGGEVKCPDNFYWDKDSSTCMPKKAYDLDNTSYDAAGYKSDYDPYAHYLGFSGQPGKPPSTKGDNKTTVTCPEGYVLDPKTNQCVPANSPSSPNLNNGKQEVEQRTGSGRVGTTGNAGVDARYAPPGAGNGNRGKGSSGSFENMFDNYDYSNPEGVFNQTVNELSEVGANKGSVLDKVGKGISTLAGSAVGAPLVGGLVYSAVNKAANLRGLAQANANATVLANQGLTDQAKTLRDQVSEKAKELGLDGVPEGLWDGSSIATSLLEKLSITPESITPEKGDTTPEAGTGSSSAPTTSVRPQARPSEGGVKSGNSSNGGYNAQGKSGNEGNPTGGDGSGSYDNNGKSGRAGTWNKGGLVTKPKRSKAKSVKKSKAKVNSKKGLGLRTM